MFRTFYSPNILASASSSVNEDSLSVSVIGGGGGGVCVPLVPALPSIQLLLHVGVPG